MRVVITGGAGFLGSHLSEYLSNRGHDVIAIDDLSTGRLSNLEQARASGRLTFIRADVRDGIPVRGPVDAVAHLASPASPPDYLKRPIFTLTTGSNGTHAALDFAERHGARFVLASTSEVYGDPEVHPQPETYWGNVNSVGPRSVYDEAKRYAEALTTAYGDHFGTNVGIVRIFNTFGPRMSANDGRVVSNFISQALDGTPLTVYGDGTQTRSLCAVADLVVAIAAMLESDVRGPVNIGNPTEMTILEIAEMVRRLTASESEIEFHPLPQDDPTRRRPDISRAKALLGWEPRIGVEAGIAETIEWHRSQRGVAASRPLPSRLRSFIELQLAYLRTPRDLVEVGRSVGATIRGDLREAS